MMVKNKIDLWHSLSHTKIIVFLRPSEISPYFDFCWFLINFMVFHFIFILFCIFVLLHLNSLFLHCFILFLFLGGRHNFCVSA